MAPPLSSLLTLSFALALLATLLVAATLRLLYILPKTPATPNFNPKRPYATRVLVVLGSGGHTHEMFNLLHGLDTRKYTHRTYVVSSGDAFSMQRAVDFERGLEAQDKIKAEDERKARIDEQVQIQVTDPKGRTRNEKPGSIDIGRPFCTGEKHYDIAVVPRARKIHQSLLTTPLSCLWTLLSCFPILLSAPKTSAGSKGRMPPHEAAASDIPDLIITNGPATAVIVVLASMILRFFNWRGANSRGKAKTIYVESFARVKTLSLSGKILVRVVDRFLVQWEELKGAGGRAEYMGILVG